MRWPYVCHRFPLQICIHSSTWQKTGSELRSTSEASKYHSSPALVSALFSSTQTPTMEEKQWRPEVRVGIEIGRGLGHPNPDGDTPSHVACQTQQQSRRRRKVNRTKITGMNCVTFTEIAGLKLFNCRSYDGFYITYYLLPVCKEKQNQKVTAVSKMTS